MKIKNNSSFSQGEVCGTGRKFASYVLDFLTSVILMVLVFTISESIMNSTAMMKGYRSDIMTSYSSLIAMIEESGISEADEKENLLASSVLQQNYMKGAVLHSLKVNNVDGISEDTYKDVKEVDATNDYAFSYFVSFKSSHLSDYEEEGKNTVGSEYYYDELVKYASAEYFSVDENSYPLIAVDSAKAIDNYFRDSSYSIGSKAYSEISSSYSLLISAGIKDLQNNYKPYKLLFEGYQLNLKKLYKVRYLELFLCYLFTLFIIYMLFPLLFRNGQTLSMKILKIGATDKKGNDIAWYQLFIKYAVNVFEYFLIISVVALLFYGTDALDLIGSSIFWNISYLSLGAFSFIFMACSLLLTFCLRKTRQSISEYLSFMVVRDTDVMKVEEVIDTEDEYGRK